MLISCEPHLDLFQEVRRQSLDVNTHVFFQDLGKVGEEGIAVLVQLCAVEGQSMFRLTARVHENVRGNKASNPSKNMDSHFTNPILDNLKHTQSITILETTSKVVAHRSKRVRRIHHILRVQYDLMHPQVR